MDLKRFLLKTISSMWQGVCENVGTVVAGFLLGGGYLAASFVSEVRSFIHKIPTEWVLTPLVLLIVVLAVLLRIHLRQRKQFIALTAQTDMPIGPSLLVTHYGVWWKIYTEADFIEDMPYCPCCSPPAKLVQTQDYPVDKFRCPNKGVAGVDIGLYGDHALKRSDALKSLYRTYFDRSETLLEFLRQELQRLTDLYSGISDEDLVKRLFNSRPLDRLEPHDQQDLMKRFQKPDELLRFLYRHYRRYRKVIEGHSDD